jgi:BirA family biotin operon repressor/biotin-[acetyl-CoA-carboxylase] ligase
VVAAAACVTGADVELLEEARIRAQLRPLHEGRLQAIDVLQEVDSTNTRLLSGAPPPYGCAAVCIAELQLAGRGRRGRSWIAPPGSSVTMSVGWAFREAGRELPALSLAVGVAVARALARSGVRRVLLKWPNDIWIDDRKIGGILLELRTEAAGPAFVVIGIGINIDLSAEARRGLEAAGVRAAALVDACARPPSRNSIAGAILDELLGMLVQFEQEGFAPFLAPWTALDALRGRATRVLIGDGYLVGRACGVDGEGAFLLEVDGQMRRFNAAEVSLRLEGEAA